MSTYYKYKFISPERVFARVKEELKSYFATGVVDDVMFPLWVEDCIREFRRTYYPIREASVCIDCGKGELPCDFKAVREAWATSSHSSAPFVTGGSLYYGKDYHTITLTDAPVEGYGLEISVETHAITRKVTKEQVYTYHCTHLLRPGNVSSDDDCPVFPGSGYAGVYDVDDCHLLTSFDSGVVHMVYYSDGTDEDGLQLIPDEHFVKQYIEKYIIYKLMLQIFNQTTDETFSQVKYKMELAENAMLTAKVKAEIESRSETLGRKIQKIKNSYRRHNRYKL